MDLYEAMRGAPTSRLFKPDPVAREMLVRALENARFAPSGGNRQGWRVVVVEDPERRRALQELYLPSWRAYTERTGAAAPPRPRAGQSTHGTDSQTPDRSGFPSAVRGVGASRFTWPSAVFGTFGMACFGHCASTVGDSASVNAIAAAFAMVRRT